MQRGLKMPSFRWEGNGLSWISLYEERTEAVILYCTVNTAHAVMPTYGINTNDLCVIKCSVVNTF